MYQKIKKCSCKPLPIIRHPECGFTLLEILIAIFIFTIIVTTLFASFNTVFSGADTIDRGIAPYEMAKNSLNRMILDLESIHVSLPPEYSPPDFDDPPDPYRIYGDTFGVQGTAFPRLRFTSLSHISFGGKMQNGIAEVVYYIQAEDEDNDHYVLKRSDNLYPYPPFEEKAGDPVLCEDVKSLQFKYYDQEGREYDLWDSDAIDVGYATPRAVAIKLELGNDSKSLLFETMATLPVYREKKNKK